MRKEKVTLLVTLIILLLVSSILSALWLYRILETTTLDTIISHLKTPIFIRALCSSVLMVVSLFVGIGFILKSTIGSFNKKSVIGMLISIIFVIIGTGLILGDQKDAYFGPLVTNKVSILFPKSITSLGYEYLKNTYEYSGDWYYTLLFPISITFLCIFGPLFMWMADRIFRFDATLQNRVLEATRKIPSPVTQVVIEDATKSPSKKSTKPKATSAQPESETTILKRETTLTKEEKEQKEEIEQTALHEKLMKQRSKRK